MVYPVFSSEKVPRRTPGHRLGERFAANPAVKGSAGYVATEKVSGSVAGPAGSFCLQHSSLMSRCEGKVAITVIPDSGTGERAGIAGTLDITLADGQHGDVFTCELPPP